MSNCVLSLKARATGPDLHLCVYINQEQVFSSDLVENTPVTISHEFDDSVPKTNTLLIVMAGKTFDHTVLDEKGNILSDSVIEITDVSIDDIELDLVFQELSKYSHNFNDTGSPTVQKFYGTMGCNGSVELEFKSPVYQWLLENM